MNFEGQAALNYGRGAYDTTGVKKPGAPPPPPSTRRHRDMLWHGTELIT